MSALRPSNLPKLAVCPCYESNPVAGPAAERGTLLDSAFRAELLGLEERLVIANKLTADEIAAVAWAVSMVRAMSGRERVLAREDDCRVKMLGLRGTADAVVPAKFTHFDLKTGMRYNYREQMAAYALGFMESQFVSEWTAHLLYCDQREVETLRFTYDEAKAVVDEVIVAFHDLNKQPCPCDYCGWCAKAETCTARRVIVAETLPVADPGFDFEAVAADPEKLGRFLATCAVIEDFHERAKKLATTRIKTGGEVPGWKLVTRKGAEFVDCETVGRHIQRLGFGPVLAAYGNLSAAKFRDLWVGRMPGESPFPEEAVKHAAPMVYLKQSKPKATP
ncbi:MAG: DUF2800 domain-containing protein [Akkermansiaceae bacterium]|nr:DUF2800 domain-containing protein [Akkermansiaceae bacterium]MCF7732744.1 DUF2800 domain-containing protein [Akkermansiaceae bacterium]